MFGIGMQELAIILVVALLIFGPKRLPELARTLGKGLAEFRRASNDLRQSFMLESDPPPTSRPGADPRASREQVGQPDQLVAPEPPEAPPVGESGHGDLAESEDEPAAQAAPREPTAGGAPDPSGPRPDRD